MLHHQQPFIKHQFCSFNPSYQMNSHFDGTGDIEFAFSGARKTQYYEHTSNLDSKEIEFQVLAQKTGDESDAYFPPLWKTNSSRLMEYESSPLLHHHHCHRNLSPGRRSKVIAEGRKELMEMIQNMPETSYELSLKDIVDEQEKQIQQEVQEEIVPEETSFQFQTEEKIKKQKKKKKPKAGQISRSGSMDNETFMIKIFFPSFCPRFLRPKKKPTAGNSSKVLDYMDKDWWKQRFFVVGESKYNERNSSSISRSRQSNGIFSQGCWPLFHSKKSKTWRQRCIF